MDRQIITINTSGTITLDFDRDLEKNFIGNAAITGAKTIALRNDTNAEGFLLTLSVTTDAALTFPSSFQCETSDTRWNSGTKVLTLTGTGSYTIAAIYDGANWKMKAATDGGYA